jgi:hypothetical protein
VGVALLALARGILSLPGVRGQGDQAGAEGEGQRAGQRVALRGDQLFDLLSAAMSLGVVLFLWNLNAGTLYFWMKVRLSHSRLSVTTGQRCFRAAA